MGVQEAVVDVTVSAVGWSTVAFTVLVTVLPDLFSLLESSASVLFGLTQTTLIIALAARRPTLFSLCQLASTAACVGASKCFSPRTAIINRLD